MTVSPGCDAQVGGGLLGQQHARVGAGEGAQLARERWRGTRRAGRGPSPRRSSGWCRRAVAARPVGLLEADRQRVRGARAARDGVEHRGAGPRPAGPGPASRRRRPGRRGRSSWPATRTRKAPRLASRATATATPTAVAASRPARRRGAPAPASSQVIVGPSRPAAGRSSARRPSPSGVEPRGDGLVVRRDDERRPELVATAEQHLHDVVRGLRSSWPVGSSARTRPGRPASTRATATRWAWPPDSSSGSAPARPPSSSRSSAARGPLDRLRFVDSGEEQRQRHVLDDVERRNQAGPLEHHPHRAGPYDGGRRAPARRPAVGRSRPASRCSSVDLPEPGRPDQRDPHARRHGAVDAADRAHLRRPRRNVRLTPVQRTRTRDPVPAGGGRRSRTGVTATAVAQAHHAVGGRGQGRAVTGHDDRHVATGGRRATGRGSRPRSPSPARRSARRRAPPPGRRPARPRAPRGRIRRRRARPGRRGPGRQTDRRRAARRPAAVGAAASGAARARRWLATVRWSNRFPDCGEDADVLGAQSGPAPASGRWLIRSPADPDGAAVRVVQPGQAAQQRRLARPGGPDQRHELARGHVERHTPQGQGLVVARAEEAVDRRACRDGVCGRARRRVMRCHRSESVTIRHGSTLSAPVGPARVSTACRPPCQNA